LFFFQENATALKFFSELHHSKHSQSVFTFLAFPNAELFLTLSLPYEPHLDEIISVGGFVGTVVVDGVAVVVLDGDCVGVGVGVGTVVVVLDGDCDEGVGVGVGTVVVAFDGDCVGVWDGDCNEGASEEGDEGASEEGLGTGRERLGVVEGLEVSVSLNPR
jgi:hypothetical protein